jgi:hypothetical protein
VPPIARHELDLEPEPRRHLSPQCRKMAGLEHDHTIARRQRVRQRRLPRPGPGRRVNHDGVFGLKHPLHAGDDLLAEHGKFRPAVIDRRHRDGLQHPVGHIGRPRDLQKMAAGMRRGCVLHRNGFLARRLAECGRETPCRQGMC